MKKLKFLLYILIIILIVIYIKYIFKKNYISNVREKIQIEKVIINSDKDKDGVLDLDDILEGAKLDAQRKPIYKDGYYNGGYPPETEGVCTDVIWRAFKNAGYELKDMIDFDIKNNIKEYPRVENKPDPNIDFRRVQNLISYFKMNAKALTIKIVPYDINNLKEWQAGDIVVFDKPHEHIAIVSNKRREDGVPYIIHNSSPYTKENDMLIYWNDNISKIIYHFRFPKETMK